MPNSNADTPHARLSLTRGSVRVWDAGPPEGEAVLLVHGMSYPLEVWGPLTERLVPAGYRVVRYDLYGRGQSTYTGGALTSEALARQAVEVLDAVGVSTAHGVTLSNGDLITCALGIVAPERMRSLTLVAPSGWDARTMNPRTRLACRLPLVAHLFGASLRRRLAARMGDHAARAPADTPESTLAIYDLAARSVLDNPHFAAAAASHLGHMPTRSQLTEMVRAYAATATPTTLVHYDEESDATAAGVRVFVDHLPAARHEHMRRGTHMGLLEYPDALATCLLEGWAGTVDEGGDR